MFVIVNFRLNKTNLFFTWRNRKTKSLHQKQFFLFQILGIFWGLYTASKGNTFISAFCSRWWFQKLPSIVSAFIRIQNGTIVSVHSDVTNSVNTRFRRNLRSDRKRRSKSDIAAVPGPHCSSVLRVFRTGNEQLVPAGPAELSVSLFEGSDSVDI